MKDINNILKIVAYNIKYFRNKLGISQEELSFRCGLHKNYISDMECAKRNISLKSIAKITIGLQIKPQELFINRLSKSKKS